MAKTIIVYEAENDRETVELCFACATRRVLIEGEKKIKTSSTDSDYPQCYDCKEYIEGIIYI